MNVQQVQNTDYRNGIEGNPFITRFKTLPALSNHPASLVLKVIHL